MKLPAWSSTAHSMNIRLPSKNPILVCAFDRLVFYYRDTESNSVGMPVMMNV